MNFKRFLGATLLNILGTTTFGLVATEMDATKTILAIICGMAVGLGAEIGVSMREKQQD